MNNIIDSQLFWVTLTIGLFLLGKYLSAKTKFILFNPVLFSVTVLIILLKLSGIEYSSYKSKTDIISFFLAPSVIALALPLYKELEEIKKNHMAIFISLTAGSLAGLISVSGISLLLGADTLTVISLLPKSVTSAIAIEISTKIGGEPSLTAGFVVITGIIGAGAGLFFLRLINEHSHKGGGLAIGCAAHALGTAAIAEKGETYAAYGGLALCVTGIITSLLAPVFSYIIKYLFG